MLEQHFALHSGPLQIKNYSLAYFCVLHKWEFPFCSAVSNRGALNLCRLLRSQIVTNALVCIEYQCVHGCSRCRCIIIISHNDESWPCPNANWMLRELVRCSWDLWIQLWMKERFYCLFTIVKCWKAYLSWYELFNFISFCTRNDHEKKWMDFEVFVVWQLL